MSSVAGRRADAGAAVYNMTKFGVHGFSEALRQEALHAGVRVTVVAPGFVETELQGHNANPVVKQAMERKPRADRRGAARRTTSRTPSCTRSRGRSMSASTKSSCGQPSKRARNIQTYVITYNAVQLNGNFGARVRTLREAMDLSLRDLAERSGVSAPMLSQVERGETSPTLAVAERIAGGLELTLSQLLRLDETDGVSVVRAAERRRGGGARPPLRGAHPAAARAARRGVAAHPGARRLDRRGPTTRPCTSPAAARPRWSSTAPLRLVCDGVGTRPRRGRRVTFDSDLPHHFENPGPARRALLRRRRRRPAEELTDARKTLFDKIWDAHEVADGLLYIDLHLVHEVTSPQAFECLRLAGRTVRRPDRTLATADHNVPTDGSTAAAQIRDQLSRVQVETLEDNCRGVRRADLLDRLGAPGDRARDRPRARRHPAGHDDRLRRLAHLDPRRLRRARVRHRHERGRARARHPDAAAAQAEVDARSATRASSATA